MSDDISVPVLELVERANDILNTHWLAPDEPWEARCRHCRDGECPRLKWAEKYLTGLLRFMEQR